MNLTTIESEALTIQVSPLGAELHSIKSKDGTEYLWQAGPAWPRHSPVLFPIVGRLKNDTYHYEGKSYKLGQHGFARDKEFRLVSSSPTSCTLSLPSDEATLQVYPFEFMLTIIYTVSGNKLTCMYEVINEGKGAMFFSIGAHPGFLCSLAEGEQFEDYQVTFQQRTFLQTSLKDGLRTNDIKVLPLQGKNLDLTSTIFDNDAIVLENCQVNEVALVSRKSGRGVLMDCNGWPYFGIWSKKGNREFVCLEPWYGIADHIESTQHLEKKDGIISLEPGKDFSCQFSISIT